MLARMGDIHICTDCRKTGHTIKSHRGGIRTHHHDTHFYGRAKEIADKYGVVLPIDNLKQTMDGATEGTADETAD